ncbi:MAG: hypothetical protein HND44_21840 [Chloroflexi bacterium]|nr:hypothetical protein [Ardenticatenaceae bacterium]NOG37184.1 hypothetical protein [Chloroflexota bacterium]GIK55280.1 MAG: hypothetical protein BroJett015_09430 [Chloroflexota bacterium]
MIETNYPTLSIRRQCELIGLPRASFYWQPAGESPLNLELMRLIDQEYHWSSCPFVAMGSVLGQASKGAVYLNRGSYIALHRHLLILTRPLG